MTTIPGEAPETDEPGVDPSGEPQTGEPDPESNAVGPFARLASRHITAERSD